VTEFQPVAVADDASAAGFKRHTIDVSSVTAGAVRQDEIAVGGERESRVEVRHGRIVNDQSVRAVAPYSGWISAACDARPRIARTALDLQDDLEDEDIVLRRDG